MPKEMLINVSAGEECRIAVVDNGKLEELYMERASSVSHVGNVYKGKVTNVEASIQAAFVDFGIGRNGFLHISDLMPTYFGKKGENIKESVGRKMARRDRPPIQQCLRRGDEIIVQVIKEGIGTKGPTLSTYLSIPGRILVMMPGVGKSGVSKKIEDEDERRRLREILDKLNPPKDAGFIIRTAGIGKSKQEIERDFKYLMRLHENIEKAEKKKGPLELYAEGDLVMRTVRDVFTSDIERIVVDDKDTAKRIKDFFKLLMPRTKNKVEIFEESLPLFHKYNIETDIEQMHSRTVPLPSGGSLVIDQTEAVVAIDVNSGKFRDNKDAETTAFKTDIEAADEIPRQLKLRDLGGVVICDFIDLRFERHRRELEARLAENLKKDRAKTRFLRMSEFGIVEMTRQRMRPSLKKSVFHDCPHCSGHGLVKTAESMGLDVLRRLAIAVHNERVKRVELSLHPDVAVQVLNKKRHGISTLEDESQKKIIIKIDSHLALDQMKFELFDEREGAVWLEVLGMSPPQHQGHGRGRDDRFRKDDRRHDSRREERRPQHHEREDLETEHDDEESSPRPAREPDKFEDDADVRPAEGEKMGDAPGYSDVGDHGGRSRRRRRGRRGRGRGGDDRGGGGGEQRGRPQAYSNDPGVEEFADVDVEAEAEVDDESIPEDREPTPDREPTDRREGGRGSHSGHRDQNRNDRAPRDNRDDRGRRDDRPYRDDRGPRDGNRHGRRHGGPQNQPNRAAQPQLPSPPADDDFVDDGDRPEPGNSIHGPETHIPRREEKRGRRGRRGRGRGPSPEERTAARLPQPSNDSLVARFLTEPVDVPIPDEVDEDDVGNSIQPARPQESGFDRGEQQGGGKRRRRRRGGRGRGQNRNQDPNAPRDQFAQRDQYNRDQGPPRDKNVRPHDPRSGPRGGEPPRGVIEDTGHRTGSTDRHQVDDKQDLPDVSQFLKPTSPSDLEYLPEYEDDE